MAKWKVEGMEEYIRQLEALGQNTDESIKRAVYVGAGIVADSAKAALNGIITDDDAHKKDGEIRRGPTSEEKASLISGFGLSKMRNDNGYINTKLGFHGKNVNGLNNSGVARQIESGTSWMAKQPVISRAINSSRARCEQAMADAFDNEIKKIVD